MRVAKSAAVFAICRRLQVLVVMLCLLVAGRAVGSTLKPCDRTQLPYLDAVEAASYKGVPGDRVLSAVVQPSFQPHWGVAVYRRGAQLYLVRVSLNLDAVTVRMGKDGPVYGLRSTGQGSFAVARGVRITPELYGLLNMEWERLLDEVVKPSRPVWGLDGTTYALRLPGHASGELSSPPIGSFGARLVNVLAELAHAAQEPGDPRPLDAPQLLRSVCGREVSTGEAHGLDHCLALGLFPPIADTR